MSAKGSAVNAEGARYDPALANSDSSSASAFVRRGWRHQDLIKAAAAEADDADRRATGKASP